MIVVPLSRGASNLGDFVAVQYAFRHEDAKMWRVASGWEDWGPFTLHHPDWKRASEAATRATARQQADIERIHAALAPTWSFSLWGAPNE